MPHVAVRVRPSVLTSPSQTARTQYFSAFPMPSRKVSSLDLTPPAKDFDYMPSHRSPRRRRHSFSMLPGSRILPFSIRSSTTIEPFVSSSAHKIFKFTVSYYFDQENNAFVTTIIEQGDSNPGRHEL